MSRRRLTVLISIALVFAACESSPDPSNEGIGAPGGAGGTIDEGRGGAGGSGAGGTTTLEPSIVAGVERDPDCGAMAFRSCGGNVEGTWTVARACSWQGGPVARVVFGRDFLAECAGTRVNHEVQLSGTIAFEAGQETRNIAYVRGFSFTIPDFCADALDLGTPSEVCAIVESFLPDGEKTGGCVYDDRGCECEVAIAGEESLSRAYEVRGASLIYPATGDSQRFCVAEDSMLELDNVGFMTWLTR